MTAVETLAGELDRMNREYDSLLCLLHRALTGEVDLELIEVDLPGRCWRIAEEPLPLSEDCDLEEEFADLEDEEDEDEDEDEED